MHSKCAIQFSKLALLVLKDAVISLTFHCICGEKREKKREKKNGKFSNLIWLLCLFFELKFMCLLSATFYIGFPLASLYLLKSLHVLPKFFQSGPGLS